MWSHSRLMCSGQLWRPFWMPPFNIKQRHRITLSAFFCRFGKGDEDRTWCRFGYDMHVYNICFPNIYHPNSEKTFAGNAPVIVIVRQTGSCVLYRGDTRCSCLPIKVYTHRHWEWIQDTGNTLGEVWGTWKSAKTSSVRQNRWRTRHLGSYDCQQGSLA